jgi:GNAT superfamily N-acetyltransferase
MRRSVLDVFPRFHDERETAAAARYLTEPDTVLIDDGTYFVCEADGQIVACGGWSKRNKLYTGSGAAPTDDRRLDPATEPARVRAMFVRGDWTRCGLGRAILARCVASARAEGFRKLVLMATLPGVPLYRSFGFRELGRAGVPLPNGVVLDGVSMEYRLTDVDAVVQWVDVRDGLPGDGMPVAVATSGTYPPEDGTGPGEDFWTVLPMRFAAHYVSEDGTEHRDCFVDSDRVVRLPYGRSSAEQVTHWASLPSLPGMTVSRVLGEDARSALRKAMD